MQSATLKIKDINKLDVQADNNTVLDVTFELYEGETVLEERRQSFALGTTPDEMQAELQKVLDTYNSDRELHAKNAELDAQHAQADETIAAMTGISLEPTDKPADEEAAAEESGETSTEEAGESGEATAAPEGESGAAGEGEAPQE